MLILGFKGLAESEVINSSSAFFFPYFLKAISLQLLKLLKSPLRCYAL